MVDCGSQAEGPPEAERVVAGELGSRGDASSLSLQWM